MSDLSWNNNVDLSEMSEKTRDLYDTLKEFQRETAIARKAFEQAFAAEFPVPAGQKLVFGYKFGKLSLAVAKDDSKPKVQKVQGSLQDWISKQMASGLAV